MATTNPLLLLLIIITVTTVTARPCKTVFYISSSSTTTTTTFFPNNNNSNNKPSFTALILTTTTTTFRKLIPKQSPQVTSSVFMPMKLYSSVANSVSERSNAIMSVVSALMFGVGCGALTAATVFFIWLICSPRGYDEEEKMMYVEINQDGDLNKERVVPLAKEVV